MSVVLGASDRQEIRKLLERWTVVEVVDGEPAPRDYYVRGYAGPSYSKRRQVFSGVRFASGSADANKLADDVARRLKVVDPGWVWVEVVQRGENHADDSIRFEVTAAPGVELVEVEDDNSVTGTALRALLATNQMLIQNNQESQRVYAERVDQLLHVVQRNGELAAITQIGQSSNMEEVWKAAIDKLPLLIAAFGNAPNAPQQQTPNDGSPTAAGIAILDQIRAKGQELVEHCQAHPALFADAEFAGQVVQLIDQLQAARSAFAGAAS